MSTSSIYLDYNASTPLAEEALEAMLPVLKTCHANPSSPHGAGTAARLLVERARSQVAGLLGCEVGELILTGGGTESNNMAIRGAAHAARRAGRGCHIVRSAVEHPSVTEVCAHLEREGFTITVAAVDSTGLLTPAALEAVMREGTVLVTVMHANNEVGTIMPIRELAGVAHRYGALMHTDAAQSAGKIPVRVQDLQADMVTLAGHKLYGPKGVGALYVKDGVEVDRVLFGAGHESGRRPGTENVPSLVALGSACALCANRLEKDQAQLASLRDRLHTGLRSHVGQEWVRLNGHEVSRLPNTVSLAFRRVDAGALLAELGDRVEASAGAACHGGDACPLLLALPIFRNDSMCAQVSASPVLVAMGVPTEWAMGTVRFSVGRGTTDVDVDRAVSIVGNAVLRMRPREDGSDGLGLDVGEVEGDGSGVHLTRYTHGLGCACKLRPQALESVLSSLPVPRHANLLVGTDTADDAAAWRLPDGSVLVSTIDFFTPIVDDPFEFGMVAAANAFSDVYAMGATPFLALNVVGFPSGRLPLAVLRRILEGAQHKAEEAGVVVAGGHSVEDAEPKFGMAVMGIIPPGQPLLRNSTARVGDSLVLTKPLGLGIITTAAKRGLASGEAVRNSIDVMATLNRGASAAAVASSVSACTDVTGFGLLGHLKEMCKGSGVDATIRASAVPVLPEASALVAAGAVPGGTVSNLDYVADAVTFSSGVSSNLRTLLADAQTSGGLLLAVSADHLDGLLKDLASRGAPAAAHIGEFTGEGCGRIAVVP